MEDLKMEINIIPHLYQGKDGAFAGPECAKFLNSLEKFKEWLTANDALSLYYNFFLAFKRLKDGTFGTVLADNWKELCTDFRTSLTLLHPSRGVSNTPKNPDSVWLQIFWLLFKFSIFIFFSPNRSQKLTKRARDLIFSLKCKAYMWALDPLWFYSNFSD